MLRYSPFVYGGTGRQDAREGVEKMNKVGVLAGLALALVFTNNVYAFDCKKVVVDEAGLLGDQYSEVRAAAKQLRKDTGAVVRVWTGKKSLTHVCPNLAVLEEDGPKKDNVIVIAFAMTGDLGVYYGNNWKSALGADAKRIVYKVMKPKLKKGQYAEAFLASLAEISSIVPHRQVVAVTDWEEDEAVPVSQQPPVAQATPKATSVPPVGQVQNTVPPVTQAQPAGGVTTAPKVSEEDGGGCGGGGIAFAFLLLLAGVLGGSWYRKTKARNAAQEAKRTLDQEKSAYDRGPTMASLQERIQKLSGNVPATKSRELDNLYLTVQQADRSATASFSCLDLSDLNQSLPTASYRDAKKNIDAVCAAYKAANESRAAFIREIERNEAAIRQAEAERIGAQRQARSAKHTLEQKKKAYEEGSSLEAIEARIESLNGKISGADFVQLKDGLVENKKKREGVVRLYEADMKTVPDIANDGLATSDYRGARDAITKILIEYEELCNWRNALEMFVGNFEEAVRLAEEKRVATRENARAAYRTMIDAGTRSTAEIRGRIAAMNPVPADQIVLVKSVDDADEAMKKAIDDRTATNNKVGEKVKSDDLTAHDYEAIRVECLGIKNALRNAMDMVSAASTLVATYENVATALEKSTKQVQELGAYVRGLRDAGLGVASLEQELNQAEATIGTAREAIAGNVRSAALIAIQAVTEGCEKIKKDGVTLVEEKKRAMTAIREFETAIEKAKSEVATANRITQAIQGSYADTMYDALAVRRYNDDNTRALRGAERELEAARIAAGPTRQQWDNVHTSVAIGKGLLPSVGGTVAALEQIARNLEGKKSTAESGLRVAARTATSLRQDVQSLPDHFPNRSSVLQDLTRVGSTSVYDVIGAGKFDSARVEDRVREITRFVERTSQSIGDFRRGEAERIRREAEAKEQRIRSEAIAAAAANALLADAESRARDAEDRARRVEEEARRTGATRHRFPTPSTRSGNGGQATDNVFDESDRRGGQATANIFERGNGGQATDNIFDEDEDDDKSKKGGGASTNIFDEE